MPNIIGMFPFGQPVCKLTQTDRDSKRVFVLGVYASAVHARWVGLDGKDLVRALAVASEPHIFWRGHGVQEIISGIDVPPSVGRLEVPGTQFNGPSGIALDELFLEPLGLERVDAWLCDLVPHSCMNPAQRRAIQRCYIPLMDVHGLPPASAPPVPRVLADDDRRAAILAEIVESQAEFLILLGDQPIRWFLAHHERRWKRLADFGTEPTTYGRLHEAQIGATRIQVLPLAHPRQAARLGRSSAMWYELHQVWMHQTAGSLLAQVGDNRA